jgi:large subunit ribosomal protein L6
MNNILKTRLQVPSDVQFFFEKNELTVSGSQGSLAVKNIHNLKRNKSLFYRLVQKAILGVSLGFVKRLVFVGVGYRVESISKDEMTLKLGFSHLISIKIPATVTVYSPKRTVLILKSFDLQFLNEFVSFIRSHKRPDIYKGKGILLKNELIHLKDEKKK